MPRLPESTWPVYFELILTGVVYWTSLKFIWLKMPCRSSALKLCLSAGLVAGMMVFSAAAQDNGQSIIFSKPGDDSENINQNDNLLPVTDATKNARLPTPVGSGSLSGGVSASFDPLPGSQGYFAPQLSAQQQRQRENQKNWTLLTPEEIMGLPAPDEKTSEQIFGGDAQSENLTPEQRYLLRQDRAAAIAATNALNSWGASESSNPFGQADANGLSAQPDSRTGFGPAKTFNSIFAPQTTMFNQANQPGSSKPVSQWTSAFNVPVAAPAPSDAQMASMDRFRALLGSAPPPVSPANGLPGQTPLTASANSSTSLGQFDALGRPLMNPANPDNNLSQPTGLSQLKQLPGYRPAPPPQKSLVQLPPWLRNGPPDGRY